MIEANTFGHFLTFSTFGESRSKALGVIIDGCPAGLDLSDEDFCEALEERRSQYFFETPRKEKDRAKILSGVFEGRTIGTPIAVIVENEHTGSNNYENLRNIFRPGHADAAWQAKFGFRDFRGGGRSSGRETLARVLAGVVAKKLLDKENIVCTTLPYSVNGLACKSDGSFTEEILSRLKNLKASGNSCGGIVLCQIIGVPAGLGEPVFSKLDAELAKAMLSVGAVKAIEFGAGFDFAKMDGLTSNELSKNYNGGIIGGISTGETIYFKVAVKAVPSIAMEQKAFDDSGNIISLKIRGEHDTCLIRRICPVLKAMMHLVIADFLLLQKYSTRYFEER